MCRSRRFHASPALNTVAPATDSNARWLLRLHMPSCDQAVAILCVIALALAPMWLP